MLRARSFIVGAAALALAGCGSDAAPERAPVAEVRPPVEARSPVEAPSAKSPVAPRARPVAVDDAEADSSFAAADPGSLTEKPPEPGAAKPAPAATEASGGADISPGAPSDAQIARELEQMEAVQKEFAERSGSAATARLNPDGTATPPRGAPESVRRIISAANAIAKFPYVYGGGHGSFIDTAYDCSGSVSYALAAAGLVERPMVSGRFARTGAKGPGKWITIYANDGHMFMVVAGLRFDTSGRGGPLGSRWQTDSRSLGNFEVRHPPGF